MLLSSLVSTSRQVAQTSGRIAKIDLLAGLLKSASPNELEVAIAFLSGAVRQTKLGVGYSALQAARPRRAATNASLGVVEVDAVLARLAATTGKGSAATRSQILADLFGRSTAAEQDFLFRLLIGELRQGALAGLMTEAVAKAAGLEPVKIRRAAMVASDLGTVALAALTEGAAGLARFGIELFRPVQPMLAQPAENVADAIGQLGEAAFEYKLDGARVQLHKRGADVKVYSRLLNDVTAAVPEVVDVAATLPWRQVNLDGEAIALGADGRPLPFQVTMKRFGSRLDVEHLRAELPLRVFFFDILFADGASLADEPYARRSALLANRLTGDLRPPRLVTRDKTAAEAFLAEALAGGHEGLMAKALDARYEAGSRGAAWLKIKRANTLDLVVLAAEWGHGRRKGLLSNLHLGARDPATRDFVMLGKTFKGLTDELLAWQTRALQEIVTRQDDHVVFVRPELVVEIAFNGLQASPHYPGGLALRFARVVRYRPDKTAAQADTIETVRRLSTGSPSPEGRGG